MNIKGPKNMPKYCDSQSKTKQYCFTKLMEFEIYVPHTTHHDSKQLTDSERESRKDFY